MDVRAHILVYGEVQGVFFRRTAKKKADELGVVGLVRNRRDESVELIAQGDKKAVEKFIKWCEAGPPLAKVDNVEVEWKKNLEDFDGFEVED